MARYPDTSIGLYADSDFLTAFIPDVYIKQTAESTLSDTTLSNDAELVNIPLAVGTHWIRFLILAQTVTTDTQDFKTQWSFTGTWNNPVRLCVGPGPANTAARDAVTPMQLNGVASNASAIYGLPGSSAGFVVIKEETYSAVVTVAGNLALQWAQNASIANNTTVGAQSTAVTRRVG